MKFRLTIAAGVAAAAALVALTAYRPDETGVWAWDIRWVSDVMRDALGTIIGLLIAGAVAWILPIDWEHVNDGSRPATVRAATVTALAGIFCAIVLAVAW